jgi:seryl-tRNA synthetase
MLDIKFIRENLEKVKTNIINKNESSDITNILQLDENRRSIISEVEQLKNKRNIVTNEIARLKKEKLDAEEKIQAMKEVSDTIKELDDKLRIVDDNLFEELLKIPNIAHETVPVGKSEAENIEIRRWGEIKEQPLKKNHIEISKSLGILDFERAAKVSGAGFAYYVGKGAALERAIINFMLEEHIYKHNYTELMTPLIVNRNSMVGTGQIPKLAEDMYFIEKDNLYLIPTAEVPITNFYNGEMLKVEDLPIKLCAYSQCFRREAGSYGKDTRGFLRVHQFNKVEMVKFSLPEESYNELETLVCDAEDILKAFNIPYRVLLLATGDTSFSSAKTYDLETWSPAENKWLEVSSCSNFEDFQARRANIRFKRTSSSKPEFIHTLNGSGVATSRLIVSILENNLQEDGSVLVPEVLRKYCRFDKIEIK